MNPIAIITVVSAAWHFIPEERREKYVNRMLDLVEDLGSDAISALRRNKSKDEETEEDHF